jgi:hypothetical protein
LQLTLTAAKLTEVTAMLAELRKDLTSNHLSNESA